ncbi:histidine--tRNA ligase [candidate division SR1 bacterium]|nr:histidine--tRNA ligase [candidate division SR1 bacterium]
MLRPSGFIEYSPAEQRLFDQISSIISDTYESFGYTHIHTPAVEANSVLLSKNGEETGKQIFGLYGLAQGSQDLKDYSLHFDLTVPFARYILDRESDLSFPFKRYQIQPVWRGERAQKGRFREFFQCDIDTIWKKDTGDYLFYDAEVIFTLSQTLSNILKVVNLDDTAIMHISNKKLILGFLQNLVPDDKIQPIASLIDKYSKIGLDNFKSSILDMEVSLEIFDKIHSFITTKTSLIEVDKIASFSDAPLFLQGFNELKEVAHKLESFQSAFQTNHQILVDLQIIRGLDYYTGTVFEATLHKDPALGSICGGGRYETLTGFIDPKKDNYAGVGGSIGITRLLSKLFAEQKQSQNTCASYLFLYFPETLSEILSLASTFISEGKKVEIYPSNDKLGKQFGLADKKGIPNVVILGEGEKQAGIYKIKNMQTGEEISIPKN